MRKLSDCVYDNLLCRLNNILLLCEQNQSTKINRNEKLAPKDYKPIASENHFSLYQNGKSRQIKNDQNNVKNSTTATTTTTQISTNVEVKFNQISTNIEVKIQPIQ